mmetsp:Transcript_9102/g.27727  ORF Transcript_9102/g.27727 Transcript_9102/m.27727 type:complete len:248 (-) Transcript_9102:1650-2393(-)
MVRARCIRSNASPASRSSVPSSSRSPSAAPGVSAHWLKASMSCCLASATPSMHDSSSLRCSLRRSNVVRYFNFAALSCATKVWRSASTTSSPTGGAAATAAATSAPRRSMSALAALTAAADARTTRLSSVRCCVRCATTAASAVPSGASFLKWLNATRRSAMPIITPPSEPPIVAAGLLGSGEAAPDAPAAGPLGVIKRCGLRGVPGANAGFAPGGAVPTPKPPPLASTAPTPSASSPDAAGCCCRC